MPFSQNIAAGNLALEMAQHTGDVLKMVDVANLSVLTLTRAHFVQIGDLVNDNFSNYKTHAADGWYISSSVKSLYADDDGEVGCLRLSSIARGERVSQSKSKDLGKIYRFCATKKIFNTTFSG